MEMQVGMTVAVQHRSGINPKTGLAEVYPTKHVDVQPITSIYNDGKIQVASGDVWTVVAKSQYRGKNKRKLPKADYVTIY